MHDDKQMMMEHQGWPLWPFLPVKKRSDKPGEWPTCGVITVDDDGKNTVPTVYEQSVDEIARDGVFDKRKVLRKYENIDSMVADGWVVD